MNHFDDALKCVGRAHLLARDLDKVRDPGSLSQIAAGLQQELVRAIRRLSDGLDVLREDAAGDRPGKVRNDALATSRAAGVSVTRPGSKRAEVLLALYRGGHLTDFDIQERLKMDPSTERPRRGELVDAGFVAPLMTLTDKGDAKAVTRRHHGREWQLWELTAEGEIAARTLAVTEAVSASDPEPVGPQQLF